jgi:hypothetical protein
VVEYGGGINNGPAGQVGGNPGGAGSPELGTPVDFFGTVGNTLNDATAFVSSQPLEVLILGAVIVFLGLVVLRRAF